MTYFKLPGREFVFSHSRELQPPLAFNVLMWQAAILTGLAVIFGLYSLRLNETYESHTWTPFESMMYHCFHRTAWSLALCWVVFSCVKGYGGVIDSFLSWKAFLPLSRLTYMAYLNHLIVINIVFFQMTTPLYFTHFLMSQFFIGIMCFTFGVSFVQSLVVEAPIITLEKVLLGGLMKPKVNPPPYQEEDPQKNQQLETVEKKIPDEFEQPTKVEEAPEEGFNTKDFIKDAGLDVEDDDFKSASDQVLDETVNVQVHSSSSSDQDNTSDTKTLTNSKHEEEK